ncbi:MAG TPA: SDR family NAD(P)-dependent oxidoreductase, partial [Alphaproteobacteria bacterium]|nr:SDR family NAD(P)-dependent oxidoreductase [Alphaproteobacteria bacterium]
MRNPKHILITGASSGIGAALAKAYAAPGIRLSLHGLHPERLK